MWRSMQEAASAHAGVSPPFLGCHVVSDVRGQGQDSAPVTDQVAEELHSHSGSFSDFFDVVVTRNFLTCEDVPLRGTQRIYNYRGCDFR